MSVAAAVAVAVSPRISVPDLTNEAILDEEGGTGARGEASLRLAQPIDGLIGARIGNYRITSPIGEGGMGRVYAARHSFLDRTVAIKVLHPDFAKDAKALAQFIVEAQAASAVEHANIVSVLDFGEAPGTGSVYLVMELMEGARSLKKILDLEKRLPAHRAINVLNQLCRALESVHARSIVHGDIKPENVLVTRRPGRRMIERVERDDHGRETVVQAREEEFDFVKLCDFGTACLLKTGAQSESDEIMGTPDYIAPEIARGNPYDHRADIYSLGVMLFELLTGRVPFVGDTVEQVLRGHVFNPPPDPREVAPGCDCTESAVGVIQRALAKNPDRRFQSMHELRVALQGCYSTVRYAPASPEIEDSRLAPAAPPPLSTPPPRLPARSHAKLRGVINRLFAHK